MKQTSVDFLESYYNDKKLDIIGRALEILIHSAYEKGIDMSRAEVKVAKEDSRISVTLKEIESVSCTSCLGNKND